MISGLRQFQVKLGVDVTDPSQQSVQSSKVYIYGIFQQEKAFFVTPADGV